jgi:uncharacterized protein YcbK (DUF882 family)
MSTMTDALDPTRRRLIRAAGAALLSVSPLAQAALTPDPRAAAAAPASPPPILFQPVHRAEPLDWKQVLLAGDRSIAMRRDGPVRRVRYGNADGSLDRDGYLAACYLLRDVRADRMARIDPHLLDVLCGIQRWMDFNGRSSTIEITSGYRTLETNESAEGSGRHSMHLVGKAADIMVPGAPSRLIGEMVQRFNQEGGTGIYLGKGFVHVDTGAARTWVQGVAAVQGRGRRRRRRAGR